MSKQIVNHVIFCIDSSGSMSTHRRAVDEVVRSLSKNLVPQPGQLTLCSLYTFADNNVRHVYSDVDPSTLSGFSLYPNGGTPLIDAAVQAINTGLAQRFDSFSDHSYLLYVITDGEENTSRATSTQLRSLIASLPENWTVATLVPNARGVMMAKNFGFPAGNIQVWNANDERGFEEVGRTLASSYADYSLGRSRGIVSTTSLFQVDANKIDASAVRQNLVEDKDAKLYTVQTTGQIRPIVESLTGKPYVMGSAFYELNKREIVQPQKEIAVISKKDGKKYFGRQARQLLGFPDHQEVKAVPGQQGEYRIFIQSTSVNRKLYPNEAVLVRN